jgi:cell division protein FtsI (penicillin-binding protein 3)
MFSTIRAGFIFSLLTCLCAALIGRVAWLQTAGRQNILARADRQEQESQVLPARRGTIFDANGILMAGTIQTSTLFIDARFMFDHYQSEGRSLVDMDKAIAGLAAVVDKRPFEIAKVLGDNPNARFVKIAENLDDNQTAAIGKLNIPGAGISHDYARYYPLGAMAAHILGGVGTNGIGLDGLELKFNNVLAGRAGYEVMTKDGHRRAIGADEQDYAPPRHGQNLVLTIDTNIQLIAEQELADSCQEFQAHRGEVVVMDPRTGAVLALANYPTFNPQNPEDSAPPTTRPAHATNDADDNNPDPRRNSCLVSPFEPGSIFKPFIAGPAFAWNVTNPLEIWPIPGGVYTTPYGRKVTDVHAYGPLPTWDVLVKSSNIGMSLLGERLGNARLYRAITSFAFGRPTGIELPGESTGLLNPLAKWTKYSTESVSQGYEVMVTPLQLARAMCAYANGGHLIQPHLIKGVLDADGNLIARTPTPDLSTLPQIVDTHTVEVMRRILCDVPIRGTAAGTRSDTWNIFGKTGTAHISLGKAGYSETRFNSSFICGGPAENPQLVIAFIIHDPNRNIAHYGGAVAGPGAMHLMERALSYMQVPPSPDLPPPPPEVAKLLWEYNPKLYEPKKAAAAQSVSRAGSPDEIAITHD